MSAGDDTRVLNMRINNKEFLKGTGDSLKAIDTLNKGIDGAGKGKGMQNMAKDVDTVRTRFGALQIAGVTALATITNKAVNAGLNLAKSFTIGPILDGFREYEKLLTSTQTIVSNTGKELENFDKGERIKIVGGYLDALNDYSDQTIYNFGTMADAIGKFTAAGVKLQPSVDAIKGMANAAALFGSDAQQLNTAMYQVSQALSSGTIKLMDWNSLVNAGMGGQGMQDTLKATARTFDGLGGKMDTAIKKGGSFRESLQYGWLEAKVFTKAMKVMGGQALNATSDVKTLEKMGLEKVTQKAIRAGGAFKFTTKDIEALTKQGFDKASIAALETGKSVAYTAEQLQKMGYSKEAAKDLSRLSASAIESATKIKTFTQLMDVLKESVGSGWAMIFRRLFGDLEQAGKLWTKVGNTITGAVDKMFRAADLALGQWQELGGYEKLWGGLGNVFKSIGNILRPVLMLFAALLPGTDAAGTSMYNLTNAFYQFSVWLERITSGTAALNPVIELLGSIVGAVFGAFMDLLMLFKPLGGALVELGEALGDINVKFGAFGSFKEMIAGAFDGFNQARLAVLEPFADALTKIVDAFKGFVSGDLDAKGLGEALNSAFKGLGSDLFDLFDKGKDAAKDLIAGLRVGISDGGGGIKETLSGWVDGFVAFFKGLLGINSPSTVFAEFGRNIVEGLIEGIQSIASGIGVAISAIFGFMKDQFSDFDRFDLANVISAIFGGAVFLTVKRFLNSLSQSMSTFKGFAESIMGEEGLVGEMKNTMQSFQNSLKAKALLSIALAIGVLAVSLWLLSKIPGEKLVTGMAAIGVMMRMLTVVMADLAKNAATTKTAIASMTAMGFAMLLLAASILVLSAAILAYGNMDNETLVRGITAVAAILAVMAAAAFLIGKAAPTMILASAGILILSFALVTMLGSILAFAAVDGDKLQNGMEKIAATLLVLAAAGMALGLGAAGLLIGAVGIGIMSVAMMLMLGTIMAFSKISWSDLRGGIGKIAAVLVVLGAAAGVAAIPLALFGAAMLVVGAGFLLFGTGLALAGIGLATLAAAGTAAAAVLISAVSSFLAVLPALGIQAAAAVRAVLEAFAQASPEIVDALVTIAREILRGFDEIANQLSQTMVKLFMLVLNAIVDNTPKIAEGANDIIVAILEALAEDTDRMIQAGTDLIVAIITGIGEGSAEIVTAAGNTLISFLEAMDTAVNEQAPRIGELGRSIATGIVTGLITGFVPEGIRTAIQGLVDNFVNFFRGLLGINSPSTVFAGFGGDIVRGLVKGITGFIGSAASAAGNLGSRVVNTVVNWFKGLPGKAKGALSSLGGTLKTAFSNAFKTAVDQVTNAAKNIGTAVGKIPGIIRDKISAVGSAAKSLGKSILNGIGNGIGSAGNWVKNLAGDIKSSVNRGLGLPKRVGIKFKKGPINIDSGITIPAFAKGVTGFGGGAALVGEAGPELVTMGRGANVITNKNLIGFMKQVSLLTKRLASGSKTQSTPGGSIQYVVGADFRGDPKRSGTAFAANIAAGLINGLKANQVMVNTGMASMANGLSQSFADVLQINSPSKVFEMYARFVGAGFIKGLVYSVDEVKKASAALGDASILALSKTITEGQLKLESIRGKANAYADAADELRYKARRTKSKKLRKRIEAEARALDKKAKAQDAAVAAQAKRVETENAAAERREQYDKADTLGKADMRREDAATKAAEASAARERAIRFKQEAALVRKRDKKRAKELDKQAQIYLGRSKTLADQAEKYALESHKLTEQAKLEETKKAQEELAAQEAETKAQLQTVTAADVLAAQSAFDAYTRQLSDAQSEAVARETVVNNNFEQHNYSPEAISPADAYRNGKSLLSIAERKLAPTG